MDITYVVYFRDLSHGVEQRLFTTNSSRSRIEVAVLYTGGERDNVKAIDAAKLYLSVTC